MVEHDLAARVEGLLHEPTQVHERGVDLTVADVRRVTGPGRVDFGGGELEPAGTEPVERVWRDESDDYRWWHLDAGQYLVSYNESLTGDEPVSCQTRDAVRARGAFHPSVRVTELEPVPLSVGDGGLRVKENARVSTLLAPEQ
jgi:hypothetical protein